MKLCNIAITPNSESETVPSNDNSLQDESAMLPKFLAVCVPLVFDVARSDKDREIVCCALECINEMLKEMKGGLVGFVIFNLPLVSKLP